MVRHGCVLGAKTHRHGRRKRSRPRVVRIFSASIVEISTHSMAVWQNRRVETQPSPRDATTNVSARSPCKACENSDANRVGLSESERETACVLRLVCFGCAPFRCSTPNSAPVSSPPTAAPQIHTLYRTTAPAQSPLHTRSSARAL